MALRCLPVMQTDLFDGWDLQVTDKTRHEDEVWESQDNGYKAGREGYEISACPYPPGSELHAQWNEWWHKGQASRARELGPDEKVVTASRTPRRVRQTRIPGTGRRSRGNGEDAKPGTAVAH
jgi:ribosome modulation factor